MLVELRGKLDEVRRHVGAGESRVLDAREHGVQRVPELVEHRLHVIEAQQAGWPRGRFGEVRDVETTGLVPAIRCRPRTRLPTRHALVVALEIVAVQTASDVPSASNTSNTRTSGWYTGGPSAA